MVIKTHPLDKGDKVYKSLKSRACTGCQKGLPVVAYYQQYAESSFVLCKPCFVALVRQLRVDLNFMKKNGLC